VSSELDPQALAQAIADLERSIEREKRGLELFPDDPELRRSLETRQMALGTLYKLAAGALKAQRRGLDVTPD
jgi:hypothetical protein